VLASKPERLFFDKKLQKESPHKPRPHFDLQSAEGMELYRETEMIAAVAEDSRTTNDRGDCGKSIRRKQFRPWLTA
jgi:hypothetical protein